MTGTLHVVATPIGNLEDITLRGLRVLREAAVIAAEDTRRTGKLLSHHGISTPTVSFHAHNTRTRVPQMAARLKAGESVALVSDAGTPGISDPGLELVQACIREGIPVDPLPGPSAVLASLVASGFPAVPVTFLGFVPARSTDRSRFVSKVSRVTHTVVFFETPHRIQHTLVELGELLGNRPLCVARELTKLHQEFIRGPAIELAGRLKISRGELTIVVGPADVPLKFFSWPIEAVLVEEFGQLTKSGLSRRQAIAALAARYGRPARDVYRELEAAKRAAVP